jgi:limonene-1,2-epoxide hydrolase
MNDVRWRIFQYAQNGDTMFLEGVDDFVNPEGRRVVIPYAGVLVFRGKLVAEWRDYFDRNLFNKIKAGEAAPDYITALEGRTPLF